jgi:hypothetical protein
MEDTKKAGILVHGCFLLGTPGDKSETFFYILRCMLE